MEIAEGIDSLSTCERGGALRVARAARMSGDFDSRFYGSPVAREIQTPPSSRQEHPIMAVIVFQYGIELLL